MPRLSRTASRSSVTREAYVVEPSKQHHMATRKPGFLRLSVVMGVTTAFIVLVVASCTFAITYTTSLSTVQSIGEQHAKVLVDSAANRAKKLFDFATAQSVAVQKQFLRPGFMLPSDDPTNWTVLDQTVDLILQNTLTIPETILTSAVLFDDGSLAAIRFHRSDVIIRHTSNAKTIPAGSLCCAEARITDILYPSMVYSPTPISERLAINTSNNEATEFIKKVFVLYPMGFWGPFSFFDRVLQFSFFCLPAIAPVQNRTTYLGMLVTCVGLEQLKSFVDSIPTTTNGKVFVIDTTAQSVVTSTAADPKAVTYSWTTDTNVGAIPKYCASSHAVASPGTTNFSIACRALTKDYAYDPLQAVAADTELMNPKPDALVFKTTDVGGDRYYVAAAGITSGLPLFGFAMLVFLPESDILGGMERSRDIAIAIVCLIFFFAVVFSSLVIVLVLRPVSSVSRKMKMAARLHDTQDDDKISALREVAELQIAYSQMSTAMGSFTRYVPRDVVKDLMATGKLCQIQMEPKNCTMLFVDIEGFTSICERVPVDELSKLITLYFEKMSAIVMTHGGLIDKFIGDCIMAVWGAPFAIQEPEVRATLCGLLINRETRVDPLASDFDNAGELLRVRVGVASGHVLAGNMGSKQRMNYTVIGDSVNHAARLEALNKQFGTRVMIDETTKEKLRDFFCLRLLMKVAVVGKEAGSCIYEVVGLAVDAATTMNLAQLRQMELDMTESDGHSMSSFASGESVREPQEHAARLMDLARNLKDSPIVATAEQDRFARLFSLAAQAFVECRVDEVLGLLQPVLAIAHMESPTPTGGDEHADEVVDYENRSIALLRGSAQRLLSNPALMQDFDGTWHATEK